jgi:hypothetical protein
MPMPAGWATGDDWGYGRQETSLLKPTGRGGSGYANARPAGVSTPPMCAGSTIAWCAIPVRVSVSSGGAS